MSTIIKRGSKWAARVRIKGISLSQSFVTKSQAQAWATQTEAKILNGTYDSGSDKTLGDAIDRYVINETPKKKSAENETYHLGMIRRHDIAEIPLARLTTEHLSAYRDELTGKVKNSSARRYLTIVGSVLKVAHKEWKWIAHNPMTDLKKPPVSKPRDRIFSDEEIERICDLIAGRRGTDLQQTVIDCFLFAIETGMRAGEICGLEWDDIDGRVATLHDTKNGDKRRVPLSIKAVQIIDCRRQRQRPFDIKPATLSNLFSQYLKYSGIKDATFHDARHTAVTNLSKKLQPFELARMVGHRNLSQTLAYFSASAEDLADKLD